MNILRRMPTAKLIGLIAALTVLAGSITAVAFGALSASGPVPSGGPVPVDKLAKTLRDAASAPAVQGVTANITFTNNLIDSSSIQNSSALLKGATGRLWASNDGRLRLELQSSRGDTQVLLTPTTFSLYDASSNTAYQGTIPARAAGSKPEPQHALPSVAKIQDELTRLMQHVGVSAAMPTDVGGAPAYSVSMTPKHSGGLLGSAQIAWDSVHGIPLRLAVYAQNSSTPVLALTATKVSFGAVDPKVFDARPPACAAKVDPTKSPGCAKIVQIKQPTGQADRGSAHHGAKHKSVDGVSAVGAALPFKLVAPATLAGLPRSNVKLLDWSGKPAALVTYGQHLGAIVVVERAPDAQAAKTAAASKQGESSLPSVSINGATGTEIATALGTLLRFERGGVSYLVAGSVPPAAAETAARGL